MGTDPSHYDTLYGGVPPWLADALWSWIADTMTGDGRRPDFEYVRNFETLMREWSPTPAEAAGTGVYVLRRDWEGAKVLRFVDYLIHRNAEDNWPEGNELLETVLADAGSAWRVGQRLGYAGLEQRVPSGVVDVAEGTMREAGDAGRRLSEAWAALYGQEPDYSRAYSLAVKAVEDAALGIVIPNDETGTLGKAVAAMRQQGDWSLSVPREHRDHPSGAVVLGMMQTLWSGQVDRHGGSGPAELDRVSAEVAIGLATPLVLWFHSGVVHRAES